MVGTLNTIRIGVPKEIKSTEGRDDTSAMSFWEETKGDLVLTSYVVTTKSKGKTNIIVLSTVEPLLMTTKDDGKCKPAIIKLTSQK